MTYPGSGGNGPADQYPGGPYGPPQGPPGYGPPGYGQPGYGQQPGGQYPQQGPGQQYAGQPYGGQQPTMQYPVGQPVDQFGRPYGPPPDHGAPPPRRHHGRLIGVLAAVVVLAGGGAGAWFAFDHSNSAATGSASPQAATTKLVADLSNGDVLGLVNDLPPGEQKLFQDEMTASVDQFKRMNVMKPNVNPQQASGVTLKAAGLTFDDAHAEQVDPHLTITKLTAGTITLSSNLSMSNYTDEFVHSAFPNGVPTAQTQTVNIADVVRRTGHPIRIATVQVGGQWYPSLFYSIADAALQASNTSWPTQPVPNVGAPSADAAVQGFTQALLDADFHRAIELTAPDEMGALHDAGQAIVDAANGAAPSGVKIDQVRFSDRQVTNGTDTVVDSITVEKDHDRVTVARANGCYTATDSATGEAQKWCGSDLVKQLRSGVRNGALPARLETIVEHLASGVLDNGIGLVATQVDGQWYVSPTRTMTQVVIDAMSKVQPSDLQALLRYGTGH